MSILAVLPSTIRSRYEDYLTNKYQAKVVSTSTEALHELSKTSPQLVILHVALDDVPGSIVAQAIHARSESSALIPIIFLSDDDSLEQKVTCFNAGGRDFVADTISPVELSIKLDVLTEHQQDAQRVQQSFEAASQVAQTAMVNAGELGVLVDYIGQIAKSDSRDALANKIINACQAFDLNISLQLRISDQASNHSSSKAVSNLEVQLLKNSSETKALIELEKRLLMTSPSITLLIKNMPVHEEDKVGRLRDHLCILLDSAMVRAGDIELLEQERRVRRDVIDDTVVTTDCELSNLNTLFRAFQTDANELMSDLLTRIEEEMCAIVLDTDQEDSLRSLIEGSQDKLMELLDRGDVIDSSMLRVKSKLEDVVSVVD